MKLPSGEPGRLQDALIRPCDQVNPHTSGPFMKEIRAFPQGRGTLDGLEVVPSHIGSRRKPSGCFGATTADIDVVAGRYAEDVGPVGRAQD